MLDPGIWTDEGFLEMSMAARLLFIGLVSHADDEGRGVASPRSLRAKVFPGDVLSDEEIRSLKDEVATHVRCMFYEHEGGEYYELGKWKSHQSVQHAKDSTYPSSNGTVTVQSRDSTLHSNELVNEIDNKIVYALHVSLSEKEHAKLEKEHGAETLALAIEKVSAYQEAHGKRYKSAAGALRQWGIRAAKEELAKGKPLPRPGAVTFKERVCPKCGEKQSHSGAECLRCFEPLKRDSLGVVE